jgi:hypothetical protein
VCIKVRGTGEQPKEAKLLKRERTRVPSERASALCASRHVSDVFS